MEKGSPEMLVVALQRKKDLQSFIGFFLGFNFSQSLFLTNREICHISVSTDNAMLNIIIKYLTKIPIPGEKEPKVEMELNS